MSHPIRWQRMSGIKFYRMGTTLISPQGKYTFVASRYSGGTWEATVRTTKGLQMPVVGEELPTLRDAIGWLFGQRKYATA